jgi:excisionase family DNA binding protein
MLFDEVLTTQEAARYLKINRQVLEKYLRQGEIPAKKVGRQWRINKLALDLWLAPSLASVLPRLLLWQGIFALGDKIGEQVSLSDEQILKTIKDLRKESGILLKRSS